jgi:small-conductance mechanosensitive channel
MLSVLIPLGAIVAGVLAAYVLAVGVGAAVRRAGQRVSFLERLSARTRLPFRALAISLALYVGVRLAVPAHDWWLVAGHATALACIAAAAWFGTHLLFVVEDGALTRFRTDVTDNRHARAVHTQVAVLRRLTAVAVTILAIGTMLMTFREARVVGTSLLASAGVAAAIAAFAANTLLANVVAGLQIAFGGSVRLDDVVVIEEEWGRIEEITLTYVVVHLWDDRRLILPTTYLTTKPFENWTRTQSSLLGIVTLDVDWTVSLDRMRDALRSLLTGNPLWDGRVSVVQAIDASFGRVTVRALVSAKDAPTLWDLRCLVREALITWVHEQDAWPRLRTDLSDAGPAKTDGDGPAASNRPIPRDRAAANGRPNPGDRVVAGNGHLHDDRVFSGDRRARARGDSFAGPDSA